MSKEIEAQVETFLSECNITFSAKLIGETTRNNNWTCDEWLINFSKLNQDNKPFKSLSTAYYTGIGLRRKGRNKYESDKAQKPHVASVLHSLIMDSTAQNESFDNWCDNYGYESDSFKAFNIYQECCAIAKKLYSVFSGQEIQALQEMLQEY